jgi:DNA-binding NtrC family response regulator
MSARLLVVDDDPGIRRALQRLLRRDGHQVTAAAGGPEALEKCRETDFDLAVVDLMMPGMDGLELLSRLGSEHPGVAVIILTGNASVESAVRAMKAGAQDYLTKPFSNQEVLERVRRACRFRQLEAENRRLRAEVRERYHYQNLVGSSPPMQKVFALIDRLSRTDSTVLIQGESGTGKEQVARAVHFSGERAELPFMPVDCGAVSPSLIESELFGHLKGAFTGAHQDTPGLLRAAGAGTVFLDEVGELPSGAQAKLLRALQEKEVRPVGGTAVFPIRARVIAATNRDLEREVAEGRFRQDLYYRLNVVQVTVPPLRERREDLAVLARHFTDRLAAEGARVEGVSPEALRVLAAYRWPGNIRELQNAVEHAAAVGEGGPIRAEDLPERVRGAGAGTETAPAASAADPAGEGSLEACVRRAVAEALRRSGGRRREAARILGIGEATLYRKLKKYGLQ